MGFDLGGISSFIFKWLTSFMFWGVVLFAILMVMFGSLIIRKRKKLIYPAIELTDLGAGKIGFKTHKAGWFKTRTILFGLFDYGGEDVLRLQDKRQIQNASSEDFHDINGKRGLLIIRKSDDPRILVPVNRAGTSDKYKVLEGGILARMSKEEKKKADFIPVKGMKVTNLNLLTEIAPADYRDASVKLITSTEKETRGKWEKLAPLLVFGTMGIVFMITIILIVQMVKQGQTEAKDLILQAGRDAVKCGANVIQSTGSAP